MCVGLHFYFVQVASRCVALLVYIYVDVDVRAIPQKKSSRCGDCAGDCAGDRTEASRVSGRAGAGARTSLEWSISRRATFTLLLSPRLAHTRLGAKQLGGLSDAAAESVGNGVGVGAAVEGLGVEGGSAEDGLVRTARRSPSSRAPGEQGVVSSQRGRRGSRGGRRPHVP